MSVRIWFRNGAGRISPPFSVLRPAFSFPVQPTEGISRASVYDCVSWRDPEGDLLVGPRNTSGVEGWYTPDWSLCAALAEALYASHLREGRAEAYALRGLFQEVRGRANAALTGPHQVRIELSPPVGVNLA